jgi:hypothetical protein
MVWLQAQGEACRATEQEHRCQHPPTVEPPAVGLGGGWHRPAQLTARRRRIAMSAETHAPANAREPMASRTGLAPDRDAPPRPVSGAPRGMTVPPLDTAEEEPVAPGDVAVVAPGVVVTVVPAACGAVVVVVVVFTIAKP